MAWLLWFILLFSREFITLDAETEAAYKSEAFIVSHRKYLEKDAGIFFLNYFTLRHVLDLHAR